MVYFWSLWNYIDFIPPVLMIIYTINVLIDTNQVFVAQLAEFIYLKTIITFLMWIKLLYFMRIFEPFAYLIRMVVLVIYDMKVFLFILLTILLAFADSFYGIGRSYEEFGQLRTFWDSFIYTFAMTLGDWGDKD
jgi:hypothetical protein